MSAEHIAHTMEPTTEYADPRSHLRLVGESTSSTQELSLVQRARMAHSPDATYRDARACHLTDRAVYTMTEFLTPHAKARAEMAYLAIDAFVEKITPKSG